MTWDRMQSLAWDASAWVGIAVAMLLLIAYVRGFSFTLTLGSGHWKGGEDVVIGDDDFQVKAWPEFFAYLWDESKTFEIRVNDRDYQEGDTLFIREWLPDRLDNGDPDPMGGGAYSGRWLEVEITYVLSLDMLRSCGLDTGKLDKEWCVFSFEELSRCDRPKP